MSIGTCTLCNVATVPKLSVKVAKQSQKGPQLGLRLANIVLLGLGWCLAISGLFVNISTSTVASTEWMGTATWATVPVGVQVFCSALTVVPAGKLAQRWGRRVVFVAVAVLAAAGAAVMVAAARREKFGLLVLGAAMQGPAFGVANSFRFVAAEFFPAPSFSPEWRHRAISLSVGSAVFAAVMGPEASRHVRDSMDAPYAGAYVLVAGLYLLQAIATGCVGYGLLEHQQQAAAKPTATAVSGAPAAAPNPAHPAVVAAAVPPAAALRPVRQALASAEFLVPTLTGASAFCTMAALMVAAPVAMKLDGHSFDSSTYAIEGHIIAMYLPAMLVGDLMAMLRATAAGCAPLLRHLLLLLPFPPPQPHPGAAAAAQQGTKQVQDGTGSSSGPVATAATATTLSHSSSQAPAAASAAPGGAAAPLFPPPAPAMVAQISGGCLMIAACCIALSGTSLAAYVAALVLLGAGWALVYVAASSLVAAMFMREPHLKLAVQGGMDTAVITMTAAANTLSGVLVRAMGWSHFVSLNLAGICVLTLLATVYHLYVARAWWISNRYHVRVDTV